MICINLQYTTDNNTESITITEKSTTIVNMALSSTSSQKSINNDIVTTTVNKSTVTIIDILDDIVTYKKDTEKTVNNNNNNQQTNKRKYTKQAIESNNNNVQYNNNNNSDSSSPRSTTSINSPFTASGLDFYDTNSGGYTREEADNTLLSIAVLCHRLHHKLHALQQYYCVYTQHTYKEMCAKLDNLFEDSKAHNDAHDYTMNKCKLVMKTWTDLINRRKQYEIKHNIKDSIFDIKCVNNQQQQQSKHNNNASTQQCQCMTNKFESVTLDYAMKVGNCEYITSSETSLLNANDIDKLHTQYDKAVDNSGGVLSISDAKKYKSNKYLEMHSYCEIIQINQTAHPVRLLTPPHISSFGMRLQDNARDSISEGDVCYINVTAYIEVIATISQLLT